VEQKPPPPFVPRASRVETAQIVLPGLTNTHGTIFGGILMQWIDMAAAIAAARHARISVVTASVDRLHFVRPVRLGTVVLVQAQVNYVARTSLEVGVRVMAEDLQTRKQVQATRAYLTMVAVGKNGRPRRVPPLVLETAEDRRRFAAAAKRRAVRLAERLALETPRDPEPRSRKVTRRVTRKTTPERGTGPGTGRGQ
jgi:acyl-CoA hydrolase